MTRNKFFQKIIIALAIFAAALLCLVTTAPVFAEIVSDSPKEEQIYLIEAVKEDGSPYTSGVPTTQSVTVNMKFKNTPASSVQFQYAEFDRAVGYASIMEQDWKALNGNGQGTTEGRDVSRTFSGAGTSYLYFRSRYQVTTSGGTTTYIYSDEQPLAIVIENLPVIDNFTVKATARRAETDTAYTEYDGTTWISNDIRFVADAASGVNCYYELIPAEGDASARIPLAVNPDNANERVLVLSKENAPEGFVGKVRFSYDDPATGEAVEDKSVEKAVRFDPVTPEFRVIGTHTAGDGSVEEYQTGMTSASAVTYELQPVDAGQNPSGFQYYYYTSQNPPSSPTDSGVTEIAATNGKYIYTAYSSMQNLRFMAVSGAGIMYLVHERNYETVIDVTAPIAKVTARDARGNTLVYNDGDPSVWASRSLTFVLENLANNEGARFEYRAEGASEFSELPTVNGQRQITVNFPADYALSTLKDQTVYFRITSAAGVASAVIPFRYSLAKSDFKFEFEMDEFKEGEWVKDPLNLRFIVDTTDYRFGYRVQDSDPDKTLQYLEGEWSETADGKFAFKTKLSGSINGYAVNFYAVNFAGEECAESAATPSTLKLDTEFAKLTLKGSVGGAAGAAIEEGQWVNGNVMLTFLSAGANISGYSIIKLIKNGNDFIEDERGDLNKDADGNYIDSLAYTNVYYYRVRTGAGKSEIVSYRVNIDDTAIELTAYEVKLGEDGVWMSEEEAKAFLSGRDISQNLYLRFLSNHAVTADGVTENHFVYYVSINGGAYQRGDESGIYVFDLAGKNDSGQIVLSFYLESTAIDKTGQSSNTLADARELKFGYNRIGATLKVELDLNGASGTDWNFAPVTFILQNDNDIGVTGMFVYQYSFNDAAHWTTIYSDQLNWNTETRSGRFTLGGTAVHLNGKIYFRVLNAAGYASADPVAVNLKLDTTKPDALKSAVFGDVAYTKEASSDASAPGTLYYYGALYLKTPDAPDYAPTKYYYTYSGSADVPANHGDAGSGWTLLTGSPIAIAASGYVRFYATNGHKSDVQAWIITLDNSSSMAIRVDYTATDVKTEGNMTIFRWSDINRVALTATGSATPVKYYWSIVGSGEWQEMIDQSDARKEWQDSGATFNYTFTFAMNENVIFRAVNKGGKIVTADQSLGLRIDTSDVSFDILASVGGREYDANGENNGWSNYDILFEIAQNSVNPSGVNYQYALGAFDNDNPPDGADWHNLVEMNLSSLLLDQKNNGNLQGRLWIRAAKNATPTAWTQRSFKFRVDKLRPEFQTEATYTDASGASATIQSGQWFNTLSADGISTSDVVVSLTHCAETYDPNLGKIWVNASPVRYYYRLTGDWVELIDVYAFTYSKTERTEVTFRAVSDAGLEVVKTFVINIDNLAPEFECGNNNEFSIVNGADGALNTYYVDQSIRWVNESEESLDEATVNGLPLVNGGIVSVHDTYLGTPDTEDYGKVTIIVKDKAGNKAELRFIMKKFPLTVETISLSDEDTKLLKQFDLAVKDASEGNGALIDNSRRQYFVNTVNRLYERQEMLKTQIKDFQSYLVGIWDKVSYTLTGDYAAMSKQIVAFNAYPLWQQVKIREGAFEYQGATVEYLKAYNKLIEKYQGLDILMQKVKIVEQQVTILPAVKSVTRDDYEDVKKAYTAYESLTTDQKSSFQRNLAEKLSDLKQQCEILLLQNDSIGAAIDGEKLIGGAMLQAENVEENTDRYANVQRAILQSAAASEPRALIRLLNLSLVDLGSNASVVPTGKVTVSIDIPTKYQNYRRFSIYYVSSDTNVVKVENVEIARDGRSVSFVFDKIGNFAMTCGAEPVDVTKGSQVYGTIFGITIDGQMIAYIMIGVGGLVLVLILIVVIVALRKRKFLERYDRRYKQGLAARGIDKVPKGNKARRRHPFDENYYINETRLAMPEDIAPKEKKKKSKKSSDEIDLDE